MDTPVREPNGKRSPRLEDLLGELLGGERSRRSATITAMFRTSQPSGMFTLTIARIGESCDSQAANAVSASSEDCDVIVRTALPLPINPSWARSCEVLVGVIDRGAHDRGSV